MKREKVNVKMIPDIRKSKSNVRFPLKLRITYKGERKYYASGYGASDQDAKGKLRKIRNAIAELENNAERCCSEIIPFISGNLSTTSL